MEPVSPALIVYCWSTSAAVWWKQKYITHSHHCWYSSIVWLHRSSCGRSAVAWRAFLSLKICCSESQTSCGADSSWVAAPIVRWSPDSVQLSVSPVCSSDVFTLRYAWKDWPCSFRACPVYSASRILPAPPFILNRYAASTTWKHRRLIL